MNALCLALVTLLAGAEDGAPQSALAVAQRVVVQRALESNPELLAQHRGYLEWLERHPAIATAEEAFTSLMQSQGFSLPVNRFDESLVRYPDAGLRMDAYYRLLADDAEARLAVDNLHRFELAKRREPETWTPALDYLRANPDTALTFLEDPRWVKPLPEALVPLANAARRDDPAVLRLRTAFQTLHDNAKAHLSLFPWWETLYGRESDIGETFEPLKAHFRQYPHRFWVWHRRELAMAQNVNARAWLRHWHRLVRRTEGLGQAYYAYLEMLREQPELRADAESRWRKQFGEPVPWPPEDTPPTLTSLWRPEDDVPVMERPERLEIERPERPRAPSRDDFERPAPPARPVRPVRPTTQAGDAEPTEDEQ